VGVSVAATRQNAGMFGDHCGGQEQAGNNLFFPLKLGDETGAHDEPYTCCVALTRIAIRAIKSRANFVRNSSKMC
jgi:hypothetical protein